jgi:hypothetical protein
MLAESFASNVNWTLISTMVMAICTALMWWDARKAKSVQIEGQISGAPPTNSILARDLKTLNHRIKSLEDWREKLIEKMDGDKDQVIEAGEDRARRIYSHVEEVRRELDEKISRVPNETVALLKNTGAI